MHMGGRDVVPINQKAFLLHLNSWPSSPLHPHCLTENNDIASLGIRILESTPLTFMVPPGWLHIIPLSPIQCTGARELGLNLPVWSIRASWYLCDWQDSDLPEIRSCGWVGEFVGTRVSAVSATFCCVHSAVEICCACDVLLQEAQEQVERSCLLSMFYTDYVCPFRLKNKSHQTASCDCVLRLD